MSMSPIGGPGGDVLAALRSGRIQGDEARLRAATRLLEGSFYQELFKAMRETIPEGGAISGGMGQDIFEGLLDQRVAESAALRTEGGIADALYRFFKGYGAESSEAPTADGDGGDGTGARVDPAR